jgi:syntaxin-binding protein 1
VFIAGGATYSESRSCYEASKKWNRDVILGTTDMITPAMFIRELSRIREPRQNLNLAMDKARSMPQPQQQYQPPAEQRTPPPREQSGRMGPPQSHPAAMRPSAGPGSSRNGAAATAPVGSRPVPGQPRPMPGQPRGNLAHVAHSPGYGDTSQHRPTLSDGKDGDKKDKKKKKLGLF